MLDESQTDLKKSSESITCSHAVVHLELDLASDIIGRSKDVIHDFTKSVLTGYLLAMRVQATKYCDQLYAVRANAQRLRKCLG